jgi:hypothetical protein
MASTSATLPWCGGDPGLQDLDDPGGDHTSPRGSVRERLRDARGYVTSHAIAPVETFE